MGHPKIPATSESDHGCGKAGEYKTAVSWLRHARDIYQQHNRLPEWQRYLDGILEIHQRKYKPVPILRNIR
ncbi:MAG: hypothetical protein WBO48_07965 [Candidatus Promineifilaceae bacterium]